MQPGGLVFAIDMATTFGFAAARVPERGQSVGVMRYGSARFGKPGFRDGAVGREALNWCADQWSLERPSCVVVEEPNLYMSKSRPTNKQTLRRLWGLSFLAETIADCKGVPKFITATAEEARKTFLGIKGGRGDDAKRLVYERCLAMGWIDPNAPRDLDATDAMALWVYACEQLRPGFVLESLPLFIGGKACKVAPNR